MLTALIIWLAIQIPLAVLVAKFLRTIALPIEANDGEDA